MTDPITKGLLPEGFRDRLPAKAEAAERLLRALIDHVGSYGYARVAPPLVEFEDSLVTRLSSDEPRDLLRFVDPLSQHMLALRPDMTAQVGRIAATRLAHATRPLRLSYGGPVLRVRPGQVGPEREALQVGAELVGSDQAAAAAELLAMALEALAQAGFDGLAVDLTLPDLVSTLAAGPWPIADVDRPALLAALDGKDRARLRALDAPQYEALIDIAGPAATALQKLAALGIAALDRRLEALRQLVDVATPHADVTIDPTERHGFEYQSWLGFSLFGRGIRGEVGRGGTYRIRHPDGAVEPATGFSIYLDGAVEAGFGQADSGRRIWLPAGTSHEVGARLRGQGWVTINALDDGDDARALGCTYIWDGDEPAAIG